ncbi:hypothetical protein JS528_05595 [Bifidobacterium sp. MA2]|uniref:Leucine rich repeat variant domain-containing protein n=1 Tax=Bifidobacterium santillanense TaxID=2809028 RepID=A0ABS5UPM3_9BIFI|nr:hypothetical protein [Bifidobacterium santillanense]MBT1172835.1 hypothetical protein [Bifidobacterium santillanense]
MVDYDAAVAAVQDPNADPVFLAKIAYENPEFGANVAVNPRAYPGLIRWLAEFGDDRARQTVAQLGYAVSDSPAGAHQPSESAEEPSAPAAADASSYDDGPAYGYAPSGQAAAPADAAQAAARPVSFEPHPRPASYGEDAYVQPARNPYGFTAAQAASTTDQMQMAEIARSAPELYADLARNPNLYPALVDWLAQLHDPAVDAALAARTPRF